MLTTNLSTFIILLVSFFATMLLTLIIYKKISKSQLRSSFLFTLSCLLICYIGLTAQVLFTNTLGINQIYFDYFVYIGTCFLPIGFLFIGLIFAKTKIIIKRIHLLLFIIPIISLFILWTNDFHHLFYENYSINMSEWVYGSYFKIHSIYSYALIFIGLLYLLGFSIKNAGFFSKQSILITIGILCPLVINILGTLNIISMNIYITPISFTIGIAFFALAIFKFKLLSITPIALQRIVDRMSDGYLVIDENNKITDFNETFLKMSKFKESFVRNKNIFDLIKSSSLPINTEELSKILLSVKRTTKTLTLDKHFESLKKHFHIEFSSLNNKDSFIGTLILFKDITQHIEDMDTIKRTQDTLMESERLSSLGQLIGRNCS